MQIPSGGGLQSSMNVTPLIDVVLVLLIIFMLVTPLTQHGYGVKVPQQTTVQLPREALPDQVVVRYTADRTIFLNTELVTSDRFAVRLRELVRNRPDRLIFFAGDRKLNYQEAVRFMDTVRALGAKNLAILVDPIGGAP